MLDFFVNRYKSIHKRYHHWLYGNCAVLLYHRVTNYSTDPQLLCVSPDNFDKQLKLVKQKYNCISIEELTDYLTSGKKIPRKSIAITFDDGYADNYLYGLPLLEKNNTQALFYISTGLLNTNTEYWWDAIERIVLLSKTSPVKNEFILKGTKYNLNEIVLKRRLFYERLLAELRTMISSEREEKIAELAHIFSAQTHRQTHRSLSFEELKALHQSDCAVIGAHTHMHPSLAALSYEEQYNEIVTSKTILETILEEPIFHFSYPFGSNRDFNSDTVAVCKKLNFTTVAANYPGMVNKHSNKYYFPRFLVRDWDIETFERNLNIFFAQ